MASRNLLVRAVNDIQAFFTDTVPAVVLYAAMILMALCIITGSIFWAMAAIAASACYDALTALR